MNRLAAVSAPPAKLAFSCSSKLDHPADHTTTTAFAPATSSTRAKRSTIKDAPGTALFAPIHYEPGYAYPLVVWLHGEGSNERELWQVMPKVSVRNYVGASARGVVVSRETAAGYTWRQSAEDVEAAEETVADCIEQAQRRRNIHPDRIFLAGRGVGGTMAVRLAMQFSLPLAGVISLGGALPRGNCPLARVNQARQMPLLLMASRGSSAYGPQQVADDLRLLHAAGCQVTIREYLCGDDLYTDMFSDIDSWVMERVCGAAPANVTT
jgi:phospholipase/carboxylesterase